MNCSHLGLAALALVASGAMAAQTNDQAEYNRRAASRDVELFGQLDRNADARLTREEARGDLNLGPRFDDIDVNRDAIVTTEELQRYVAARYGVELPAPAK